MKNLKFICILSASLPGSLLAVRPGSARCMDPEILDSQGNDGRFTNLLLYPLSMVITLSSLSCFVLLCFFKQGEKLTKEGVDNSWLRFIASYLVHVSHQEKCEHVQDEIEHVQ